MKIIGFDLETTNKEPGSRPVEIAAVEVTDRDVITLFDERCNPGMPIPAQSTTIHGFEDADRDLYRSLGSAIEGLIAALPPPDACCLVIHNAPFDCGLLVWNAERLGIAIPDYPVAGSLELARLLRGPKGGNSLDQLCIDHGLDRPGGGHRAYGDAWAAAWYWVNMIPLLGEGAHPVKPFSAWAAQFDGAYTADFPPGLECLPELVEQGGGLTFDYVDGKGKESSRTITPQGWAMRGGNFHFHGFCHSANDSRAFRADRIVAVRGTSL